MKRVLANLLALVGGLFLGGALMFAAGNTEASTILFNGNGAIIARNSAGQIATIRFPQSGVSLGTQSILAAIARQGGGVAVQATQPLVIAGGRAAVTVPVAVTRGVAAAAIGKIAVGAVRGSVQGIVVGAAVNAAINAAGYECDLTGCKTKGAPTVTSPTIQSQAPTTSTATLGYAGASNNSVSQTYWIYGGSTQESACRAWMATTSDKANWTLLSAGSTCYWRDNYSNQKQSSTFTVYTCDNGASYVGASTMCAPKCPSGGASATTGNWTLNPANNRCERLACQDGYTINNERTQCTSIAVGPGQSVTDDQVGDAIGGSIPVDDGVSVVQQALNQGVPVPAGDPVVSGPASVTSSPTTTTSQTTNPVTNITTTTTTTNTTTVNNTYNGDTITTTVTNNTTTQNPDGTTTTDDTTVSDDEGASVVDTQLGELPKLYERKYPDGIKGVWDTKSAALKSTPLFGLSAVFTPNISGGSCPTWTFDANIGPSMNFGQGTISPPCWIWPLIKAVVLITALLMARSLIFGG